ncbi:MAG TPA: tetratricopeptide repeat protein [Solirubrobacteraceae bacterium]|jgi:tetratricopeptide (TPR) repeat protein|nr:tetratricopeptide repeat protein [Solirubrobacteraceae bacterium]
MVGRFLGVGVDEYVTDELPPLKHAVEDVRAFRALLGSAFQAESLANPDHKAVAACLARLKDSMLDRSGALVLLWAGHGAPSSSVRLRLLAGDSDPSRDEGLDIIGDLGSASAQSGANQILLIIDTCYSGEAISAAEVVAAMVQARPPNAKHLWVGVLTSCQSLETAQDGLFGSALRNLLEHGPMTPELKVRWSTQNEFIRGDDLCDAIMKEWGSDAQTPQFQGNGSAVWMFSNPLYVRDAPERVVEHLLLAARGGAQPDERSWFTGRATEVDRVVEWVHSNAPGMHVITGSAGSGKSAIVGRVVSLSNPRERKRLLDAGHGLAHADPGERAVHAHIHARGLTADRAANLLGEELVRCGVLARQDGRTNASELVGRMQRAVVDSGPRPVIVVDGLDEARGEAFSIAEDLLGRLAEHAILIVATRELQREEGRGSLIATLTPRGAELDLDDPAIQERGRTDMHDYVVARLAGVDERMDGTQIADRLAPQASMTDSSPFLLARLVTDRLRDRPIDTSLPDWQLQVSESIGDALDADLARVTPHRDLDPGGGPTASELARGLLRALTWGLGAGFPEDEWLAVANTFLPALGEDRDNITWVLDELGRYVIQDGEDGVAVYRLAHQSLADHLQTPPRSMYEQPFDPEGLPVAQTLLDRYTTLLEGGADVDLPTYLWRYAWRHAAVAGERGLDRLRSLAQRERELIPDVALSAILVSQIFEHVGRWQDAVAPAEEAVELYRELAAENPAFQGDLASALNNLGNCYSEVGRAHDAVAPTKEAVELYSRLVEENPAFLAPFAMTLNNLGGCYIDVGQLGDAVAQLNKAVELYGRLASENPAFLAPLASTLSNLGGSYGKVGLVLQAVAPSEGAVELNRKLAGENPAFRGQLAVALYNLGSRYLQVGNAPDALARTKEAVELCRELIVENTVFRRDLAMALNNLGGCYGQLDRAKDALAPTKEAVELYRDLAAESPAFQGGLAGALSNLGDCYGKLDRAKDALAPTKEAVELYRELAGQNQAFQGELAMALANLGNRYSEIGRRHDALAFTEKAVELYRQLVKENAVFLAGLTRALKRLGERYSDIGEPERIDTVWGEVLEGLEPAIGGRLLFGRAAIADAGEPRVAKWLTDASKLAGEDRDLLGGVHDQARRHHDADPATFETQWERHHAGERAPDWLTVDRDLLATACAWTSTTSYVKERDFLLEHPELLDPSADVAIAEALLKVAKQNPQHYTLLRQRARVEGPAAAYQRLIHMSLIRQFTDGDAAIQRMLLAEYRDELFHPIVQGIMEAEAEDGDNELAIRAVALLDLARMGDEGAVLDALEDPVRFPTLLAALARRPDPAALDAAATVAYTAARTPAQTAEAGFFMAAASAICEDDEARSLLLAHARELDPTQSASWIAQLTELGERHPSLLGMLAELTAPSDPPAALPRRPHDLD